MAAASSGRRTWLRRRTRQAYWGGYGLLMLVRIGAVCFALGVVLLKAFDLPDPGVTSFFGITIPVIVLLALLLDHVFDDWMALALPLLVAVCLPSSTYLTRGLGANPSTYSDDSDLDLSSTGGDAAANEHDDQGTDDLLRYAPSDDTPSTGRTPGPTRL